MTTDDTRDLLGQALLAIIRDCEDPDAPQLVDALRPLAAACAKPAMPDVDTGSPAVEYVPRASLDAALAKLTAWRSWAAEHKADNGDDDFARATIDRKLAEAERATSISIAAEKQALHGLEVGHEQFDECQSALSAVAARLNSMTGHVDASCEQCCDEISARIERLTALLRRSYRERHHGDVCACGVCEDIRRELDGKVAT